MSPALLVLGYGAQYLAIALTIAVTNIAWCWEADQERTKQ